MKSKDFRWGDTRELYNNFKLHRDSNHLIDELKKVEKTRVLNLDFILSKLFSYIKFKKLWMKPQSFYYPIMGESIKRENLFCKITLLTSIHDIRTKLRVKCRTDLTKHL